MSFSQNPNFPLGRSDKTFIVEDVLERNVCYCYDCVSIFYWLLLSLWIRKHSLEQKSMSTKSDDEIDRQIHKERERDGWIAKHIEWKLNKNNFFVLIL